MNLYTFSEMIPDIVNSPTEDNLSEFFTLRTRTWKHPYAEVECGAIDLFGDLVGAFSPSQAFETIPKLVPLVLAQQDPDLIETALSLVLGFAVKADTTEIPVGLQQAFPELRAKADSSGNPRAIRLITDLERWYRLG